MKIIDRIEIHRFRSIGDESIPTDEINIFSGLNNSGKSNILRALNLFFNFETSYDSPHTFEKDYNIAYTGQAGGAREIIVRIHFLPQGKGALQYAFSIARTFKFETEGFLTEYSSSNPEIQEEIDKGNGTITRQFTRFLNSLEFLYIPAVRDKLFVRNLFLNFEKIARDTSGQEFGDKFKEISSIIEERSGEISNEFEDFLGLPTQAALSSTKSDIFGAVQVVVQSGLQIRRKVRGSEKPSEIVDAPVDLFSSGDGVLMSYIAYFLAHLCRKNPGKRYIWGFEEPENSLEYSKIQKLADEFNTKFRKYAQIFITTHSPAFISMRFLNHVNFYRVYIAPNVEDDQPNKRLSRVMSLEALEKLQLSLFGDETRQTEYEVLEKELGFIELSREIEMVVNELTEKKRLFSIKTKELDTQLAEIDATFPEKILIIEDTRKTTIEFWKKVMTEQGLDDVKIYFSEGCTNNRVEEHLRFKIQERRGYSPRVFRQIDRDGLCEDQIQFLEDRHSGIVNNKYPYKVRVLPVYEIENFAIIDKDLSTLDEPAKEQIRTAFEKSALSKLFELTSKYPGAPDGLFKQRNNAILVMQQMRQAALSTWNMFMPGKEIAGAIGNFSAKNVLKNMSVEDYPEPLIEYISLVKAFFGTRS
jgi:hypothetical protein